jgi:molybdenum cofactor cytidylyltransferase
MGPRNKLLEKLEGRPIVRRVVEAALASRCRPVVVVTGHQADAVEASLAGLDAMIVHNPAFAAGMSTSLKAGLAALPDRLDGAIVALGDMPDIAPAHLDRMIAAFEPKEGRSIIVPVYQGRRGNPVLWGADLFTAMNAQTGDVGARQVIVDNADSVVELDLQTPAVLLDVDTPEALAQVRAQRGKCATDSDQQT